MTVKVWTPRIDRLTIRCLSVLSLLFISCSEEPLGGATSEDLTAARSADSVSVAEPLIASECTEYYNDYNATYKLDFGNCVECRLLEPEKALDGDPSTFATAILGIIDGPIRITVTPQSGVVFPSNTAPGVWTFIRLWAETSHNLDRDIDLFLDGSVKQFLDGRYQGPWQASWPCQSPVVAAWGRRDGDDADWTASSVSRMAPVDIRSKLMGGPARAGDGRGG